MSFVAHVIVGQRLDEPDAVEQFRMSRRGHVVHRNHSAKIVY